MWLYFSCLKMTFPLITKTVVAFWSTLTWCLVKYCVNAKHRLKALPCVDAECILSSLLASLGHFGVLKKLHFLFCATKGSGEGANSDRTLAKATLRHTSRLYTILWGRQRPRWTTLDCVTNRETKHVRKIL